ncbi:hypothetical protein HK098_006653 [Nowakowskiella sp. JEL0407]|nr:hypothetical protein HK098_006653 [Nowakowskiella sp. JEL0407]
MDPLSAISTLYTVVCSLQTKVSQVTDAQLSLEELIFDLKKIQSLYESVDGKLDDDTDSFVLQRIERIKQTCERCAKYIFDQPVSSKVSETDDTQSTTKSKKFGSKTARIAHRLFMKGYGVMNVEGIQKDLERAKSQLSRVKEEVEKVSTTSITPPSYEQTPSGTFEMSAMDSVLGETVKLLLRSMNEKCDELEKKLQRYSLVSEKDFDDVEREKETIMKAIRRENYSVWRTIHPEQITIEDLPYEKYFPSWARVVCVLENKVLPQTIRRLPIDQLDAENIDLESWRFLWVPALREILDPFSNGFVHVSEFNDWVGDRSLSEALSQLILLSSGYQTVVETKMLRWDKSLHPDIESPAHTYGWMSMCKVDRCALPSSFCIFNMEEISDLAQKADMSIFASCPSAVVELTFLSTGQRQLRNLSEYLRPLWGIRLGAQISIKSLEGWSETYTISEYLALPGGSYSVTAIHSMSPKKPEVTFRTRPILKPSEVHETLRELLGDTFTEFHLLGSSDVFWEKPNMGQKIQVIVNDVWEDYRVVGFKSYSTEDDDALVLCEKWNRTDRDVDDNPSLDDDSMGFDNFENLAATDSAATSGILWNPSHKNFKFNIRPYRCLDVGDAVEVPVIHEDCFCKVHDLETSQLYVPGRIASIDNDMYEIEFPPRVMAFLWWPGNPNNPHLKTSYKDALSKSRVSGRRIFVHSDRVRPQSLGPQPILGTSSSISSDIKIYQGSRSVGPIKALERMSWKSYILKLFHI